MLLLSRRRDVVMMKSRTRKGWWWCFSFQLCSQTEKGSLCTCSVEYPEDKCRTKCHCVSSSSIRECVLLREEELRTRDSRRAVVISHTLLHSMLQTLVHSSQNSFSHFIIVSGYPRRIREWNPITTVKTMTPLFPWQKKRNRRILRHHFYWSIRKASGKEWCTINVLSWSHTHLPIM